MSMNNKQIFALITLIIMGIMLSMVIACEPRFCMSAIAMQETRAVATGYQVNSDIGRSTITPAPIETAGDEFAKNLPGIDGIAGAGIGEFNRVLCARINLENKIPDLKSRLTTQFQGFKPLMDVAGPIKSRTMQPGQQIAETRVELDIFSGVPNPTWTLAPALVSDLESRIANLAPSGKIGQFPQNLGYRGFIVRSVDARSDPVKTIHACHGVIKITDAAGSRYYSDPQKQIELWLLASSASAQPPISDDLIAEIVKEINAP